MDRKKELEQEKTTQASPATATPTYFQSATPSVTTIATQGPAIPAGGGDQPMDRNIPITPTCQCCSLPIIGAQASIE